MLTQHQIDTNRTNAELPIGARSEAGRATASATARKHGLSSLAVFLLPDEDSAEFDALHNRLRAEYFPATTSQKILVEDIARSWWKVLRADALQAKAVPADVEGLNSCERYAASARHAYHKAIDSLIKLQKVQRIQTESFQREALKRLASLGQPADDKMKPVSA